MIQFRVYGDLVAKQSTKFAHNKKTGMIFQYTPAKIKRWQERIAAEARKVISGELLSGPLAVRYSYHFLIPKTKIRKTKPMPKWKDTKPDWENLAKGVSDAVEKIIYANDGQIAYGSVRKKYTTGPEYLDVKIWQL